MESFKCVHLFLLILPNPSSQGLRDLKFAICEISTNEAYFSFYELCNILFPPFANTFGHLRYLNLTFCDPFLFAQGTGTSLNFTHIGTFTLMWQISHFFISILDKWVIIKEFDCKY